MSSPFDYPLPCAVNRVQQVFQAARAPQAAHVFTRLYEDEALERARELDAAQAQGITLGPLAGQPVSIKDLYDVAGETTLSGARVCEGEPAAKADAPAVARLKAAGAIIVGKTGMSEFAFSGVGINPHHGTPRNPADPLVARVPGGSSSGAAVSVALGLAEVGLGSDTGGSIRIPAALCGLVGFKNSQSRVPTDGAMPLSRTLDTVCAITRGVSQAVVVDRVLSGEVLEVQARPLSSYRFLVPQTVMLEELEPAVAQAFERAVQHLSHLGARIESAPAPLLAEVAQRNAPGGLSPIEAWAEHRHRIATCLDRLDPRVAARMVMGRDISAADYLDLLRGRRAWIQQVERDIAPFDALLCPTVPLTAPAIEPLVQSDEAFFQANRLLLRNTFLINFMDGCSISLPCHSAGELPVGLMLSAAHGRDGHLLGVALAVEQALTTAGH
jgi:aspartyl-tRNA(Asn)/glutamyl-tRNA(Gln) amidotransferase subunit A